MNAKYYDSDSAEDVHRSVSIPSRSFRYLVASPGRAGQVNWCIGLRSAIKVIQDILVEAEGGQQAVADQPVGWLATTVTLYDTLDKDIRRAFPSVHHAVTNTCILFHKSKIHEEVANPLPFCRFWATYRLRRRIWPA